MKFDLMLRELLPAFMQSVKFSVMWGVAVFFLPFLPILWNLPNSGEYCRPDEHGQSFFVHVIDRGKLSFFIASLIASLILICRLIYDVWSYLAHRR